MTDLICCYGHPQLATAAACGWAELNSPAQICLTKVSPQLFFCLPSAKVFFQSQLCLPPPLLLFIANAAFSFFLSVCLSPLAYLCTFFRCHRTFYHLCCSLQTCLSSLSPTHAHLQLRQLRAVHNTSLPLLLLLVVVTVSCDCLSELSWPVLVGVFAW